MILNDEICESIAFVGNVLAPFYLEDPLKGNGAASYDAFAAMDPAEIGEAWPFVEPEDATKDLELMHQGLEAWATDTAFVREYRRLFIGPGTKPAPPWGSVYTDHEMVVFGEATLELRQWMRINGVKRVSDERTPEDHIGLMLSLMAWIALNKPEALEEYLRLHFFTWSSHFLELLEESTEHPFYKGLANLTRLTLEGIQEVLEIEVIYPHFFK